MLRKSIMTAGLLLGLAMNGAASEGLGYILNDSDYTCMVTGHGVDDDGNLVEASGNVIVPYWHTENDHSYRVIGIADYAFFGMDKITSILISDNVEYIGEFAFTGCVNLKTLTLPYNLKAIASSAFIAHHNGYSGCLPETVNINNVAGWCEMSITGGYTFDNPLRAEHVFINGEETTILEIPEGVKRIEEQAFLGTHFTDIKFPSTLEKIGRLAFRDCSNITNISFGKGIKYIGQGAFFRDNQNTSIYSISCPSLVTWLGIEFGIDPSYPEVPRDYFENPLQYAQHFYIDGHEITDLVIPAEIEEIKPSTFYGGKMFTSLSLPETLTTIGDYAFYDCPFTSLNLPTRLEYIGKSAFSGCASTTLNIPQNIKYIGEDAFSGWRNLKAVEIPNSLTMIPGGIFYGCSSLTSIKLHEGLRDIGYDAFSNCGFNEIYLPSSVENIGNNAFSGSNLSEIKIPERVTVIEPRTFENCKNLRNVELPQGLTEIKNGAFKDCNWLLTIKIPEKVTSIGESAFENCINLRSVEFSQGLKSIGRWTFKNCKYMLKRLDFPSSLENIGALAFDGVKLEEIHCKGTVPPTIENNNAFLSSSGERDYIYNNAVLYVPVGSLEAYKGHDVWGKFADIREERVSEVAAVGMSTPSVEVGSDGIRVDAPDGDAHVEVYSLAGTRCYSGAAGAISLPQGCYVVVVDSTAQKVVIR